MTNHRIMACLTIGAILGSAHSLSADVKMPAIFGDHMVLQEGASLPVWGTADAGEPVTVTVGTETAKATAGSDGTWRVDLPPIPERATAVTMTVTGKNSLTFNDVLVGDVWIASGQSNMEFSLSGDFHAATELPKANDPELRLFLVGRKTALDPQSEVAGKWQLCTPDSAKGFSAVAYFFGHALRSKLNRPIGLIGSYWGGTVAQSWTSLSGLQKEPPFKNYIDTATKIRANFSQASADYAVKQPAYQADLDKWIQEVAPVYTPIYNQWNAAAVKIIAAGGTPPPRPQPSRPMPRPPPSPDGGPNAPANLFNGMIAPLIPYALKGVIWYQGESNAGGAIEYRTLFPRMISDWREKWGQGDFPFLFVQLATFKASGATNTEWALLRESQLKTLSLPNTGMASAVDLGDPVQIHPKDKLDLGLRLALAAEHIAYGQNLVYSGPIYDAMQVNGNSIRVTFTQTGSGLIIGASPAPLPPKVLPLSSTDLVGFTIAGDDKNWVPADAKFDGNAVVVSSAQVPNPVAVRYEWANAPQGNLYNKEGLPASPFRTDDWVDVPAKPVAPPVPTPAPAPAK